MVWDDTNLYIACRIEEPFVHAKYTNHNDPIDYDNDVEFFIAGHPKIVMRASILLVLGILVACTTHAAEIISLVAMDAGDGSREDFADWANAGFVLKR